VNELKGLADNVGALPRVQRAPDPTDDFLLAMAEVGNADYLVTGDKSGLLALARHQNTRIVSAALFRSAILKGPPAARRRRWSLACCMP
jgi:predicted nucleic acid-binding protein